MKIWSKERTVFNNFTCRRPTRTRIGFGLVSQQAGSGGARKRVPPGWRIAISHARPSTVYEGWGARWIQFWLHGQDWLSLVILLPYTAKLRMAP
jgi:hypothetical protein